MSVPLVAEYTYAQPIKIQGIGFDLMLYRPFPFAFPIFCLFVFTVLNIRLYKRQLSPVISGFVVSAPLTVAWFVVTFMAVVQLHISLGGVL
jgi:hypothetical protein